VNIQVERLALSLARMWVVAYTVVLPQPIKQARRAEIESDLWEHVHDRVIERRNEDRFDLFRRVVLGIPSDLSWTFVQRVTYRREHQMEAAGSRPGMRYMVMALAFVITALLLLMLATAGGVIAAGVTLAAFVVVGVVVTRRQRSSGSQLEDETIGVERGERGRALRIAVVGAVVTVATYTFGALSGELSAVGWTIFFGLFATGLLTTVGALIFLAANLRAPRP
jgi:hypothetical protein